ncbi:polysaccharide biosynthesis/export family protein [Chishuiella sp.]|uniref:polysaccharide biosynthesis/export family protein n=1 Tax=Chishuiella sp. TaxID=1969467 RepID=UPI0028AD5B34|nr:polysaccharide biosynthesis/export family protein [Chishuiella sp.]
MSYFKSTLTKSLILLILFNLFSCISLKDVQLIQPDDTLKLDKKGYIEFDKPEYHIQVNDQILINVATASGESMGMLSSFITAANNTTSGRGVYVRQDGNIELPRIGKIKLEGLTLEEARKAVQTEFYKIYNEEGTYIDVNLAGIEYTIVGEASQGVFRSQKKKVTLLDAFAQSGSNNIYADLKNIRIIRSESDGTKQVYVDLTKESIMNSEYYWVQNNDIIVVNPRKQKIWGIGLNPLSVVTTIMGAIATILGVYLFFDRL